MLKAAQYEAIGRLTLAFNEIEYVIDDWCPHFIGAAEWSVSVFLAQTENTFQHKADRFKQIIEAIAKDQPLTHPNTETIESLLKKAKCVAGNRNKYVHSLVKMDFETKSPKLMNKGKETPCDERVITDLATEASYLAHHLEDECAELLAMLAELRPSK
jgi:dGTP triphosphohydrolase